jgi:hypothetical protein
VHIRPSIPSDVHIPTYATLVAICQAPSILCWTQRLHVDSECIGTVRVGGGRVGEPACGQRWWANEMTPRVDEVTPIEALKETQLGQTETV